jgi:hypothetical protein
MPECAAIRELKAALFASNTILTPGKLGTTRPDGSRHDAGLAMDIMLDSRDVAEKPLADQLIDAFVTLHAKMKVSVSRFACLTFVPAVSDHLSDGPGVRRWTLIRTRSTRQCSLCCT